MTFADVIGKWPNAGVLARDLEQSRGAVKAWRRRNSIPSEHWLAVENAARRRGIEGVTVFVLAEIASNQPEACAS